ncbi:MAG: hypothetical protein LUH05_09615 [Candidatus Gastranaerophilales bacterium]|nr:hypothetical protein [Candidatus Gastranaerophilales bacterium]
MKVNSVSSSSAGTVFRSKNTELKKSKNNVKSNDNSDKLKAGLAGLAILGTVLVCNAVVKKNNNNEGIFKIIEKKLTSEKPDPIMQKIGDKRDAEAVKLYKSLKAQEKIDSLRKRVMNGEFNNKPSEIFQRLIENEQKLEKTARGIV